MPTFLTTQPTTANYWRGIVLLGKNVATYKLAMAKSLLEFVAQGKTFVTMEELAVPYTRHITKHLKVVDKQVTSGSSKFLEACRKYNRGDGSVGQTQLIEAEVKLGSNNVIDAFYVVNDAPIPKRFYYDERRTKGGTHANCTPFCTPYS